MLTNIRKIIALISLIFILLILINSVNAINLDVNQSFYKNEKLEEYLKSPNENFTTIYQNPNKKLNNSSTNNTEDKKPKLNKSKPIYFAMDHVNSNDEEIKNNIISKLEENGFNVVSTEIGPNKMSQNTHKFYEQNISNAIIFHLFNGVDPSTIRELGTNGDDNRGRIIRSHNNDVVLVWFYDSADPVHENGSCYKYVRGSETGPSLEQPGKFMEENDIIGICTSSDMGQHKETADYTGEKSAEEFMQLFN